MIKPQIIYENDEPKYAVIAWDDYLKLTGQPIATAEVESAPVQRTLSTLAELRRNAGLSCSEVAREAGISPSYYEMIEAGQRTVSDANKRALARAFKVDESDIAFPEVS